MIGCTPHVLARYPRGKSQCVEEFHMPIRIYNAKLKSLVDRLNKDYSDAKFVYVDDFSNMQELLDRPSSYDQGCCSIGKNHGFSTCVPHLTPCKNRDQYVFWDAYHPTEAAYQVLVKKLFGKNARSYTYPVTILQLAELRMRLPFDGSGRRLENSV
ncbi:GDSL esterase/lipase At1g29670-like [Punica granatum]|uniref:GDSL esterase/lipase At1g29670-like n=2 Tax=Punica granatum TaxID=22663 RepID=A0A6P8D6R8_PUNGR|nr:GDSL esterase/lipase At1g29670-like [Punica granatum]PKI69063.1 hypothetical protein CRG98_010532 [Punica granatum]